MVVFACNHCGDSVKKQTVDKHFSTKCRGNTINVSCMDCQKDFHGNEHVAHTKCITEAEKYSAKGFVLKAKSKNNNAKKQDSWINVVHSILENREYKINARTREAFQKLENHENIPRKKAKFENFATKCMHIHKNVVAEVWNVLEKEIKKMDEERLKELEEKKLALVNGQKSTATETTADAAKSNGVKRANKDADEHSGEPAKKKKKKQKAKEEDDGDNSKATNDEEVAKDADNSEDFTWEEVLTKITQKNGDEGLVLEKLKKKTLKKYKTKLGVEEMTDKQQKKFDKKFTKHLKKCTNIIVENDVAKIIQT